MRISDWSSDVCSSDLLTLRFGRIDLDQAGWSVPREARQAALQGLEPDLRAALEMAAERIRAYHAGQKPEDRDETDAAGVRMGARWTRSEEHTSELQSLMRISYAVFCLKKKTTTKIDIH